MSKNAKVLWNNKTKGNKQDSQTRTKLLICLWDMNPLWMNLSLIITLF